MTTWINHRLRTGTTYSSDRTKAGTKSRDYVLGSFFDNILTAIIDPKDGKRLKILTDPAYYIKTRFGTREEVRNTKRTVHKFNS